MSRLLLSELASAPPTPDTGKVRVYINSGGTLSSVDDAGVVTTYGAGITQEQVEDFVGALLQDTSSVNVTYNDAGNAVTFDVLAGGVNHNALLNYVANQHVDHSTVSITAGAGLSGGGDLTATRTISMPNTGTAGTYKSVTTDAQGRVTAGTNPTTLAGYGITDAQPLVFVPTTSGPEWKDDTGQDLLITQINSAGSSAFMQQRKARGSIASPSFLENGDKIGGFGFMGWLGSDFNTSSSGEIAGYATENHTGSAQGGELCFLTTPNGTTGSVARLYIRNNGDLDPANNKIVNVADPTNAQDAATKAYVDNANVFGQGFQSFLDNTPSSTTSNSFVNACSATTTSLPAGTYRVSANYYWTANSGSSDVRWGLFVDGSQVGTTHNEEMQDISNNLQNQFVEYVTFGSAGTHTLDLRYSTEGTITGTKNRCVIEIWRVS